MSLIYPASNAVKNRFLKKGASFETLEGEKAESDIYPEVSLKHTEADERYVKEAISWLYGTESKPQAEQTADMQLLIGRQTELFFSQPSTEHQLTDSFSLPEIPAEKVAQVGAEVAQVGVEATRIVAREGWDFINLGVIKLFWEDFLGLGGKEEKKDDNKKPGPKFRMPSLSYPQLSSGLSEGIRQQVENFNRLLNLGASYTGIFTNRMGELNIYAKANIERAQTEQLVKQKQQSSWVETKQKFAKSKGGIQGLDKATENQYHYTKLPG